MKKLTLWEWIFLAFLQTMVITTTIFMVITDPMLWVWAILIILATFFGLLGLAKALVKNRPDEDAPNEQYMVTQRPAGILTKLHYIEIPRGRLEHKLYQCDNAHHKYCANCPHKEVHEHTPECAHTNCSVVVKVIM